MATEYTLWLMPRGKLYKKLDRIIKDFSKKYSTQGFQPHITLFGPVYGEEEEIIEKTLRLVKLITRQKITFTNVSYADNYFQCIFINVKKTKELDYANSKARELFGVDYEFMPHLSLLWGNITKEEKLAIAKQMGKIDYSFEADKLYLFTTPHDDPYIRDFKLVRKFPLS